MSTPPISNLDDNTFLTILDTITCQIPSSDTRKLDRPLTIIRATSQVCQRWRGLLLASPWIWGRVVDLDASFELSGSRKIKWMDEVVRRAGSAPLWIYGYVAERTVGSGLFNTQSYFIHLLEAWERIERLSVVIFGKPIPEDIQRHFLSRAPILKLFDVGLVYIQEPLFLNTLQRGSSQSLFANHAPSLQAIKVHRVAFKLDSPWLSHIREISIPNNFTLKEVFSLLQHTPILESIRITTTLQTWDGTLPPVHKLNLPNLSSITLITTLAIAARILDYISPANLFWVHIKIEDPSSALNDPYILSSFKQNMPFYISSYFTSEPSSSFFLAITPDEFTFCNGAKSKSYKESLTIAIRTVFSDQKDTNDVLACLVDAFAHSPTLSRNAFLFKSINELTLALNQVQPTLFQNIYSMFAVLQHVQVIETNEQCGQTLWAISRSCSGEDSGDQPPILFPALNTVRLSYLNAENATLYTGLSFFLMQRKSMGFPVAKLVLTGRRGLEDLSAYEAVNGLEVIWEELSCNLAEGNGISKYICGSGEPERLKSFGKA